MRIIQVLIAGYRLRDRWIKGAYLIVIVLSNWIVSYSCGLSRIVMTKILSGHEDKALDTWISTQRSADENCIIREDRKERLNMIEFVWKVDYYDASTSLYQCKWDEMFGKLISFKEEFGHCRVITSYSKDPELADWVHRQRNLLSCGRMHSSRKSKLDSIGCLWELSAEYLRSLTLKPLGDDSSEESDDDQELHDGTGNSRVLNHVGKVGAFMKEMKVPVQEECFNGTVTKILKDENALKNC